jgi:hypothetical protein
MGADLAVVNAVKRLKLTGTPQKLSPSVAEVLYSWGWIDSWQRGFLIGTYGYEKLTPKQAVWLVRVNEHIYERARV